ncbi:hypothetical protein BG000_010403, partial [Podila horticola]
MAIELTGFGCIAVSQGVVHAAVKGYQPNGGGGILLLLIKTENPTDAAGNITWSVISTAPAEYF